MKLYKIFIIPIVFMVLCSVFIIITVYYTIDLKEQFESKIGTEIIIKKDTLKVVDYSALQDNYLLSNGQHISRIYLEQQANVK